MHFTAMYSVVDKGDMGLTVPGFNSSDAAASGAELRTRGSSQSGEAGLDCAVFYVPSNTV